MDNTGEFCCEEMRCHLEQGDLHLDFQPRFRNYGIHYNDGTLDVQIIHYCPWCGIKLPASLRQEWFDEVERLGIDPDDDELLPDRLKSDAWWRNAGDL